MNMASAWPGVPSHLDAHALAAQAGADVALAVDVAEAHGGGAGLDGGAHGVVDGAVVDALAVDGGDVAGADARRRVHALAEAGRGGGGGGGGHHASPFTDRPA